MVVIATNNGCQSKATGGTPSPKNQMNEKTNAADWFTKNICVTKWMPAPS